MEISYFSDYACPFCYIGESNLKRALEELGIDAQIQMKAFELDPNAGPGSDETTVKRFAKKYGISLEEANKRIESINAMAAEAGIPFDYSNARASNTFDAHRLTKFAQDTRPELADQLSEELYRAYFVEHDRLADRETLLECAERVGLKREDVEELLDSDAYSKDVRVDEIQAAQMDVHAVPFFILDGKIGVPGALPVQSMVEILKDLDR